MKWFVPHFSPAKKPSRLAGLFYGAGDEPSSPRAAGTPMVALPSSRQCPTVHRTVGFNCSSLVTRKKSPAVWLDFFGAGDEARTRYLHLGKVALYRMSYTRGTGVLYQISRKCQEGFPRYTKKPWDHTLFPIDGSFLQQV